MILKRDTTDSVSNVQQPRFELKRPMNIETEKSFPNRKDSNLLSSPSPQDVNMVLFYMFDITIVCKQFTFKFTNGLG